MIYKVPHCNIFSILLLLLHPYKSSSQHYFLKHFNLSSSLQVRHQVSLLHKAARNMAVGITYCKIFTQTDMNPNSELNNLSR